MSNYTTFQMFENPRVGRQARNFTITVAKIYISNRLSNRYFPKIDVGCPWCEVCKVCLLINKNNRICAFSMSFMWLFKVLFQLKSQNISQPFEHEFTLFLNVVYFLLLEQERGTNNSDTGHISIISETFIYFAHQYLQKNKILFRILISS